MKKIQNDIVLYQTKSGALELHADLKEDTVWANLNQISTLFETDKSGISRHIRNILKTGELDTKATVAKFATVQKEGEREITRNIEYYNLDLILAVGYRVNSRKATQFRKWATSVLSKHILDGYTINKNRIASNYGKFMQAVQDVRALLPASSFTDTQNILELISLFADTWLSLDAYDKNELKTTGATKKSVEITANQLQDALLELKKALMKEKSATELFAAERSAGSIEGIIGNVMQSFGGKDVYPTLEEKAAHLLYFVVKNHPFIDGNKRSGAYTFVWFLQRTGLLDITRISPPALTALTLLIAESKPSDKDKLIGLVCTLLKKK